MPMTTTHALIPIAAGLAFASRPTPWRLLIAASAAAAFPDVDSLSHLVFKIPATSIYSHRGAMHSLFVAVVAGLIAAVLHKRLKVRPLTAGVVIAAAMASHGILDMMTNAGRPVAYLWPLSSVRLYADWRPIQVPSVHLAHLFTQAVVRLRSEFWQLILPMFVAAGAIRGARAAVAAIR